MKSTDELEEFDNKPIIYTRSADYNVGAKFMIREIKLENKDINFRKENDSIGSKDIPEDVYYGVQSLRAAENFRITGLFHASRNYK